MGKINLTIDDFNKVIKKLDNLDIPMDDRTVMIPIKIDRKRYKGKGRPRKDDYIPIWMN